MSRRVNLRTVAMALLALALAGCVAIPLSTMWKMRNLSVDSFFANDPAQLRVAMQVERAMKRGPAQPKIEAEVHLNGKPPLCYAFSLDPVDPSARSELMLERTTANRAWQVFALSPAGIEAFKRARREVAGIPKGTEAEFHFGVTMTNVFDIPDDAKSFVVRIDVAMDRKDGYFTLIKETAIEIKKPTNAKPEVAKPASPPADACPQT